MSCDGRARHELRRHDYILLKPSKWPVPCTYQSFPNYTSRSFIPTSSVNLGINKTDHIGDWFKSLCECLNWNDRRAQKAFPTEVSINHKLALEEAKLCIQGLPAKETKKMRMSRTSSFSLNT